MRFLFITQYFPPEIGAPQVRLPAIIKELVSAGHNVEVITALPNHPTGSIFPEYQGKLYVREEWNGVPIHRIWVYAATGGGMKRLMNYLSFTFAVLYPLLRATRPDYIFVESPPLFLSIPAFAASRFWNSSIIFNVADLWPDSVREMGIIKDGLLMRWAFALENWSYHVSTYINAVTKGIRDVLMYDKHIDPARILLLPNGVDTKLFISRPKDKSLVQELNLEGKRVVVYTGTIGLAQGLDVLLDAASLLRDSYPDCQFVIVGDGSDKARLVARKQELQLTNVHFVPPKPLEYIARLYTVADVGFVSLKNLPLFEGARPSKLFPIMASGKPVLYSGAGEGAKLVKKAQAGIVVPPENPVAVAESLVRLFANEEAARLFGENGRTYVEKHLSWSALVEDWLQQLSSRTHSGTTADVQAMT